MWGDLTMQQRGEVMGLAMQNGIYDINEIKRLYDQSHQLQQGGAQKFREAAERRRSKDDYYLNKMQEVARKNWKNWGFKSEEEVLIHALNDNTYDYRGYYAESPEGNTNAEAHWPDTYKTVYHPTFSNESKYSGVVDRNYNPEGLVGGRWDKFYTGPAGGGIKPFSEKYVQYIPVVSTIGNTLTAISEPTEENIYRAGTSVASDINTALLGGFGKATSLPFQYGMTRDDIFGNQKEPLINYDDGIGGARDPRGYVDFFIPADWQRNNEYSKGGDIHIKPSHRGRLTELKKRTGKTEAELWKTGGPKVRRMITFARNARKWKHSDGGDIPMSEFGLWQYPNQVVDVPSNRITMKGIDYPVLGVSDTGDRKIMLPNTEYLFDGNIVREFPLRYQYGGALQDSSFINYSNPLFFQARRAGIPYLEQKPIDMNDVRNRSLYMETSGNPTAVSPAGAKGLFQIMPITHQDYVNRTGDNGDLFDPIYNEKVRDFTFDRIYNHPYIKADYPTDSVRVARTLAAYNMGPGAFNKAMGKAKAAGVDTVNGWGWVDYLPKESREYVNFGLRGMDQTGKRTNEKYQKFLASGNPYIKQYGGLLKPFSYYDIPIVRYGNGGHVFQEDNSKMRIRPITDFLEDEPLIEVDNTNYVQPISITPEQQQQAQMWNSFKARHENSEVEKAYKQNLQNEVNAQRYAELSRSGQINDADLDNRTWWSKNWQRFKNWEGQRFSLIGDLKDATYGIVDLNYLVPGWNTAYMIGESAKDFDDGKPFDGMVNLAFVAAPHYKELQNAGSQIVNWWTKPHGIAGSYQQRFNNVLSPQYWKEVYNPEYYEDAVNQVKNFHDRYRVGKLGKISNDVIDRRNPLVELFDDPLRFDYSYENIKMPIIKTDRHGNIKSIKFDKKQQNLFDKNPIGKTEIRPMGPFRYITENGLKAFMGSTGVNHGGTKFDLNLFHPNIIGVNPTVLKGIAAHEMQHTAQNMINAPYLRLSMPYNGYFGPNIFFSTFHPYVKFEAMNAPDPQPDFIDRLIRFKDNTKSFFKTNIGEKPIFDRTPLKSRKSNQWFRSPDELDAEMANFRYLFNQNIPFNEMTPYMQNKAVDLMFRRFKATDKNDFRTLMSQLSDIGYFKNGGFINK